MTLHFPRHRVEVVLLSAWPPPPPHLFLFFSLSIVPPFPFSPQGKNKSEHGTGILNIRSTVMTSLEIQPASQINFNKIENYSTYITEKYLPKNTAQISTLLKNYSLTTEKRYVFRKNYPSTTSLTFILKKNSLSKLENIAIHLLITKITTSSIVIGLKDSYCPLIHLLSSYRTVK